MKANDLVGQTFTLQTDDGPVRLRLASVDPDRNVAILRTVDGEGGLALSTKPGHVEALYKAGKLLPDGSDRREDVRTLTRKLKSALRKGKRG